MTKICPECSNEFEPNVHNQIYCCKKCKDKARSRRQNLKRPNNLTVKRICVVCGCEYFANNGSQKTCSKECRKILDKQRNKKHNDAKPRKLCHTKECKYCQKFFIPKKHNQIFCCKEHQEEYYNKTKYHSTKNKLYYLNNKEHYKQKGKKYYLANKEVVLERGRKNRAIRQATDPDYIMKKRIREQIRDHLKRNLLTKNFYTFELLGYTIQDLHKRLESLFEQNSKPNKEKLSWSNMGSIWHIDHIRPCASFVFVNEDGSVNQEAVKECWSLENLQPMYADENMQKSSHHNGKYYIKGKPL